MKNCCCVYCGELRFSKGIHTHVDRTHLKLTKYSLGNNGKYKEMAKNLKDSYYNNPKFCKECSSEIAYEKKGNTFCVASCAATYNNRLKDYSSIKTGPEAKPKFTKIDWIICKETGRYFCNRNSNGKTRKRSPYTNTNRSSYKGNKELYDFRQLCRFTFNVFDYPDRFELSLVQEHGWYKPVNRGNNLQGVSRDHMISVKYGFDNGVDSGIISHPANCRLMQHTQNASKSSANSITLTALLERIKNW